MKRSTKITTIIIIFFLVITSVIVARTMIGQHFQKKLITRFFIKSKGLIYDNILSDEGGRFYHSQIKYMACKLTKDQDVELPESYIWLSQNQIIDLIHKQKIDIEARLLFGIINFKETI